MCMSTANSIYVSWDKVKNKINFTPELSKSCDTKQRFNSFWEFPLHGRFHHILMLSRKLICDLYNNKVVNTLKRSEILSILTGVHIL